MPRRPGKVPAYCLHRASGQAVCRIAGRDHYLGPYGSGESQEAYSRLIAEWRAVQVNAAVSNDSGTAGKSCDQSISEVLMQYREFARHYYAKDSQPTKEYTEMRFALRPLRKLYGALPARNFGPLALKAVRQSLIDSGLSRGW